MKRETEAILVGLDALDADPTLDSRGRARALAHLAATYRFSFDALAWRWAPGLYERDRVVFRPVLNGHVSALCLDRRGVMVPVDKAWDRRHLERWLAAADAVDDSAMFRKVWMLRAAFLRHPEAEALWRRTLVERFSSGVTSEDRGRVLEKFDLPYHLDEATALALYQRDPTSSGWVSRRVPTVSHSDVARPSPRWSKLRAAATRLGDTALIRTIYQRQVDMGTWRADLVRVCAGATTPAAGTPTQFAELEAIFPSNLSAAQIVEGLTLVLERAPQAQPWIIRHLPSGWGEINGVSALIDKARAGGMVPLWSALIRKSAPPARFDQEVAALAESREPAETRLAWLRALAGGGVELNGPGFGFMSMRPLSDRTATALYQRFPALIRGPYRQHTAPGYHDAYPKLLDAALAAEDDDLVDFLASRLLMCMRHDGPWRQGQERIAERLNGLKRTPIFRQRASAILARVPAFGLGSVDRMIQENVLARLLLARSTREWLDDDDPALLRDLLESPNIHVQILALRALASDDPRASRLAAANLDLLLPGLLRPLQRSTRLLVLRALNRAVQTEADAARVLGRARDALDLPDRRYPRDALIGLIGRLLYRYPALRRASEQPSVWTHPARPASGARA